MASQTYPYQSLVRKNRSTVYEDTVADKELIYTHLQEKIQYALSLSADPIGTKNLIYFAVFGSDEYISMLDRCLKSIKAKSDISKFDLLFVTDAPTAGKIAELSVLSGFTHRTFIVSTPETGVDASIQKCRIFEYENIDEYSKILFLDCDILAPTALETIFESQIDPQYIETASTWDKPVNVANPSIYHVLNYFSDKDRQFVKDHPEKCHPFNAGQFVVVNSARMKAHFENVKWLIQVWPGEYYFEQSVMNHYFMLNGFTSQALLNPKVAFVSVNDIDTKETRSGLYPDKDDPTKLVYRMKIEYRSTLFKRKNDPIKLDDYYLVHFVGLSLNGVAKLKCIDQFITDKNVCL